MKAASEMENALNDCSKPLRLLLNSLSQHIRSTKRATHWFMPLT